MGRPIVLLFFGIALVGIGIYYLPNIWTNKSELINIKGTLKSARIHVSLVFSKKYKYGESVISSRKSELLFQLKEYDQEYYMAKNIGDHYINEEHEKILKSIRKCDSISLWIKRNEMQAWRPEIFQLENDETTLLHFKRLHIEDDPIIALSIGIGSLFIILCSILLIKNKFHTFH